MFDDVFEKIRVLLHGTSNARPDDEASSETPAQIKLLYESRDGRLCLFEDADGHVTAVRSSRLA
jgi:hypothetical protein